MGDPKQILVVGPASPIWDQLPAPNPSSRSAFRFHKVQTGPEALLALAQSPFVAVIAPAALPGMAGTQLLDEVQRCQPGVVRFLHADLAVTPAALRCLGRAHHVLLVPTAPEQLFAEIERIVALEDWLPGPGVHRFMTGLSKIPSPPEMYFEIVKALDSDEATLEDIGHKISRDPAVSAKLLQLVNSASFGLQITITSPDEAIAYLGLELTKSLVLVAHTYSYFDRLPSSTFSIHQLWRHSYSTARCARAIATHEQAGHEAIATSFSAGLLHDLGKLLFAANFGTEFGDAIRLAVRNNCELWRAEREVFGLNHAELGASLLLAWGLPSPLIEAIAVHHYPSRISEAGLIPTAAVHAANVFTQSPGRETPQPPAANLDLEFLTQSGFAERLEDWTRVAASDRDSKPQN